VDINECGMRMWTWIHWQVAVYRLLNLCVLQRKGISGLVELLLASQEGLCLMELVAYLVDFKMYHYLVYSNDVNFFTSGNDCDY
jgi:hypothetical protein